jgi:hypothetical protein
MVECVCHPSYSGSINRRTFGLVKKTKQKGQKKQTGGPEFKSQYHQKKKKSHQDSLESRGPKRSEGCGNLESLCVTSGTALPSLDLLFLDCLIGVWAK